MVARTVAYQETDEVYSLEQFHNLSECGVLTSYDGTGYYGDEHGYSMNHQVDKTKEIPNWATCVAWFGK